MVLGTDARQWLCSIILQLLFQGEFAQEAAEFVFPASQPGDMDRLWENEDFVVYHISNFLWEAEEGGLGLVVDGLALLLWFLGWRR